MDASFLYLLFILFALFAGALLPVQAGVNSQLSNALGNPFLVTLISFAVGTVSLLLFVFGTQVQWPTLGQAQSTSWSMWMGGIFGAVYVASTVILAQRLGATTMVAMLIAGQIIASLIIDQYGWLGFPVHAISMGRIIGAMLLVAGVFLIQRF